MDPTQALCAGLACAEVPVPGLASVRVLGWTSPVTQAHVVTVGADGLGTRRALSASQVC